MQNTYEYIQFLADDGTIVYVDRKAKKKLAEMRASGKYYEKHELSL